mmetsp:Transcript_21429/g.27239  ORF Transcript_21429/g.27239 Transcript_21429/m.27239 type:complete len:371 (-) Transcript_21429:3149-4261(-)
MEMATPVVIDDGCYATKFGFAGDGAPPRTFRTVVGTPRAVDAEKRIIVAERALENISSLQLHYPMKRSDIMNFKYMVPLWEHVFEHLDLETRDQAVLLSHYPTSRQNPLSIAEVFYETLNVPHLHIANPAELALYAHNRDTGLVIDIGHSTCYVTPVIHGRFLEVFMVDIAGVHITDYFSRLVNKRESGFFSVPSANMVKEKLCFISSNYESEHSTCDAEILYELPDGQVINVKKKECMQAPEILFTPSLCALKRMDLPRCVRTHIFCEAKEYAGALYNNILLTGGTSLLPGLSERLQYELAKVAPKDVTVNVSGMCNQFAPWMGGSMLASSSVFLEKFCISKEQYSEEGYFLAPQPLPPPPYWAKSAMK